MFFSGNAMPEIRESGAASSAHFVGFTGWCRDHPRVPRLWALHALGNPGLQSVARSAGLEVAAHTPVIPVR